MFPRYKIKEVKAGMFIITERFLIFYLDIHQGNNHRGYFLSEESAIKALKEYIEKKPLMIVSYNKNGEKI